MNAIARITAKKPEAKRENPVSRARKTDFSQTISSPIDHILFLQRTIGNQAVQRLFESSVIQAKLKIGQPNDIYEQEADRVAEQVMSMPEPRLQRQAEEEEEEEELIQTKPLAEQIIPLVQRQGEEEEEETLQAKPFSSQITPLIERQAEPEEEEEEPEEEVLQTKGRTGHCPEVIPELESRIQSLKGGGQPLPKSVRTFFEPRFGHDFSQVRIHTDGQASESVRKSNAKAYTVGRDVVFGAGQYAPHSTEGKGLLAHELAHVVQQRQAAPFAQASLSARHPSALKTDAKNATIKYRLRDITPTVHGETQRKVQRLPESEIELVKSPETKGITVEKVRPKVSKVSFGGVGIATVKYYGPGEERLNIHFRKVSEAPGKAPRLQIVLDCHPHVRIRLHRSAIESLGKRGISLEVGVRPVGIEVRGGVESGLPLLPPRETELIKVAAPEEEAVPLPPSETKEPEVTAPEEPATSILSDVIEILRTKLEREGIKALLNEGARLMDEGKDYKWAMDEAAEIALGILERKTTAFDPRSAKKAMVLELIRATEDVMLLGGGERAVETAMKEGLDWAKVQLARAVERLKETPTEADARQVAEKAGVVMLLGGDATEALLLLMT